MIKKINRIIQPLYLLKQIFKVFISFNLKQKK